MREFVQRRFGRTLKRSSCLTYLHRLSFVLKRPKKRLAKADAERRATFVREFALLQSAAQANGAKLFFADEAHFYADVDLRGKWVLRGQPALVDSTSPRWGEKVSYYSAVCLETGEVEVMELDGTSTAETSVAFLHQVRAHHPEPLIVIWDNGPAHSGDALRAYLSTPGLHLRLVRLPAYSPDFNPDEAIWGWVRAEVTANTCFGTKARVREKVGAFFHGLSDRTDEVKRRCRTILQTKVEAFTTEVQAILQSPAHVDPTLALVLGAPRQRRAVDIMGRTSQPRFPTVASSGMPEPWSAQAPEAARLRTAPNGAVAAGHGHAVAAPAGASRSAGSTPSWRMSVRSSRTAQCSMPLPCWKRTMWT